MCGYCEKVKHMQVSGGGRYAYASIGLGRGKGQYSLDVSDGENRLSVRIKYCPMCGRRLAERRR